MTGLSIDPATGLLSGTADFSGGAGFIATVLDSASPPRTATKGFTILANSPLQAAGPQSATIGQYQTFAAIQPAFSGGVFPYSFSLSGTLAPGLLLNGSTGQITGTALSAGVFVSTFTIQDSFSPPEVVTEPVTIRPYRPLDHRACRDLWADLIRTQLLPQSQALLRSGVAGYGLGRAELVDVLRAEHDLANLRIELLSAEFDQQRQLAAIERLIGGDL